MIKNILVLSATFFIASCAINHENNIQILTAIKVVDSTKPDFKVCENFQLTEAEITSFFNSAEQVSNEEAHGESLIMPCQYSGKLTMNKKAYTYELFAGGTRYIYDENGWVVKNFICKNNCCRKISNLC